MELWMILRSLLCLGESLVEAVSLKPPPRSLALVDMDTKSV